MKHVVTYLGIGLAVATVGKPAMAGAHTYNTKVQTIRCGVLLENRFQYSNNGNLIGNAGATDPNHVFSYVFHALNARSDIRPPSWDILNPFAAPFMDGTMAARWGISINANNPPRLNKNMGAYWEVYLHESTAEQLATYDILYMPLPQFAGTSTGPDALTVADREKLRRAIDAGTILWLDNAAGGGVSAASAQTSVVTPSFIGTVRARQAGDPLSALLSTPNPLSNREVSQLGARQARTTISNAFNMLTSPGVDLPWTVAVAVGGAPTVQIAQYGQGAIAVTSRAIGRELTQGFRAVRGVDDITTGTKTRGNNTGPYSASDARGVPAPELKFLINLIAYRFQVPQQGGGARHASGSRQDLNTPLGRKWQYPENFANKPGDFTYAGVSFVSDPVVWNGIVYAATSDGVLRAFDMDPMRDLDGDGNPDDGLQNPTTPGSDRIWEVALPGACSSLVLGDLGNRPRLYGMLADGRVFAADALPRRSGRLQSVTTVQSVAVQSFGPFPRLFQNRLRSNSVPGEDQTYRIPAPVWYNGRLFVVGVRSTQDAAKGVGAVAEIDPITLRTKWQFPDGTLDPTSNVAPQSRMGIPSATPTIAAIPDNGYSGATDIMLLVPSLSVRTKDNLGTVMPSRVMAFPIAVRGEKLQFNDDPDNKGYRTRFAGANAIPAVNVNVWVPGVPTPTPGTMQIDKRNGWNRMYVQASIPAGFDTDARADYDFAPGPPSAPFVGYNARWTFDAWSYVIAGVEKFMEVLTSPVVSASGGMYWVASDVGDGANQPPIVMGVEMRQQNLGFNVTGNANYMAPLNAPQLTFIYSVGSGDFVLGGGCTDTPSMPQPVVLGTPAVDRGVLYVPYGEWKNPVNSTGGVTGFFVQNTKFGLLLANPVDPAQRGSVSIVQRNMCTGDLQQVGNGLFDVDNVTIGNVVRGLLTFRSLSTGPSTGSLDLSRVGDIQVSYQALDLTTGRATAVTSEAPTAYYKSERGEGSDPSVLKAFSAAVPGAAGGGVRTGVTVAGGSIYLGSDSGEIWTVPLPTSLDVVQGKTKQLMRPATYPSLAVSAGFGSYPAAPGAALRSTPIVANGTLIVNAPVGLYSFYSPRTLITESTRIIEVASTYVQPTPGSPFASSGSQVLWSLDSTTQNREFGAPGAGPNHPPWAEGPLSPPVDRALNQPSMAIRVNSTNTLICDTGNNRVVEVDRTGSVVWQCTEFADPYGLLGANESRTLSSPTSVQRWETFDWDDQNNVPGWSQHNLIADSGNNRLLEVVTRFSPEGEGWLNNVLVWVGRGPAGKGYQFFQAQREPFFKPGDANHGSLDYGRTIASVVNLAVNSAEVQSDDTALRDAVTGLPETAGGSLVLLGGQKDTYTFNGVARSASGKVVYFLSKAKYAAAGINEAFPLARPVYFNRYNTGDGAFDWRVTMTDGANVFELTKVGTDPPGLARIITAFPYGPIVASQRFGISPTGVMGSGGHTIGTSMAKRLQNGNLLMVNQKTGYVFEFSPDAAKAGKLDSILSFTVPPIQGTAALNRPVFADRLF